MSRTADVVVPVYGGLELTRACLEAVLECSGPALGRLLVVDDASVEPGMKDMLASLRTRNAKVVVVSNERNLGFVGSVNRALALRERDVALLNSDTLPTRGWLEELLEVAHSAPNVAAVTPLSNNGALCSVPRFCEDTPAAQLQATPPRLEALTRSTQLPTGVGFCLLMRERALNLVGGLDPAFGRGYHEENDWCMRAQALGLTVLRANRALVYHLGSASFGAERTALDANNERRLRNRYPFYLAHNQRFAGSPEARLAARFVEQQQTGLRVRLDGPQEEDFEAPLSSALRAQPGLSLSAEGDAHVLHRFGAATSREELQTLLAQPAPLVVSFMQSLLRSSAFHAGSEEASASARALAYATLQAAQAVLVPSALARDQVVAELGVDVGKIHVVLPGFDPEPREAPSSEAAYLLHEGDGRSCDGLPALLAAYAELSAEGRPELRLVDTGEDAATSLYPTIERWPPGVRFLGRRTRAQRAALRRGALALVQPGSAEVIGAQALAAAAEGTPVIASPLSCIPSLLGDAVIPLPTGAPAELAAAMAAVTGVKARRVEARPWATVAAEVAALYRDVCANPNPRSLVHRRHLRSSGERLLFPPR